MASDRNQLAAEWGGLSMELKMAWGGGHEAQCSRKGLREVGLLQCGIEQ